MCDEKKQYTLLSKYTMRVSNMILLIISILLVIIAAYAIFRHFKTRNELKIGGNHRPRKR
ncbi:hypothetical protein B4923_13585 [Brenneria roseae subsp. americana]|uniref:Uncharacterized protein n=1 Tax=Brenneria roseae subsp. americana TaxID=1508507 RepID=A0A2U1TPP9_9GAMM|nr:hypothetical protein B4923_13585 [Brenneria roseae subsp. americana]